MSRIGKLPVAIPAKVEVKIEGGLVTVKGPKGTLKQRIESDGISAVIENGEIIVSRATEQKRHKAMHGLYRVLISNMVTGVSEGFTKQLELHGIGYRAANTGQMLELQLGYSHPIMFHLPDEVKLETKSDKGDTPKVILTSIDKQLLGQVAAKIREFRRPEPYKGKGVRYTGEYVRIKPGKTASK
jgi:large subunit ribosomal protein L6